MSRFPSALLPSLAGRALAVAAGWLLSVAAVSVSAATGGADAVDFESDIRPIFAESCVVCHGPDESQGGLQLTMREHALGELKSGRVAVVPGDIDASEMIRRVTSADPAVRMPPADKADALTADQVAKLKQWIKQGADWPVHWAYRPLQVGDPPKVKNTDRVRNAIDRYVLAELEARDIAPSPPADRYTLIRRLYYDLHGLPPTIEEVDAFVNDKSPDAYVKLVDGLLASPHFGERFGRHWLDKARYADSDGYEKDNTRPNAWRYRDWVIDAINRDLPYDQFVIQQLAGDLLPDAGPNERLATAFNRQTLTNTEGGADKEEFRVAAVMDRTETMGSVWLGLTVSCARCHSHKYDQVTQAEYYQLYAFFNNGDEANTNVPKSPAAALAAQKKKAEHDRKVAKLEAKLEDEREALAVTQDEWEQQLRRRLSREDRDAVAFHPLKVIDIASNNRNDEVFERQEDGSYLVTGPVTERATYTMTAETNARDITGFKIEALADKSLPARGPGRVQHGNFVLNEVRVFATDQPQFDERHPVKFASAQADFSQSGWAVGGAIDGKADTGWAVSPQLGKSHWAILTLAKPIAVKGKTRLRIVLDQHYGRQHNLGRFRVTAMTGKRTANSVPDEVKLLLALEPANRNLKQAKALVDYRLGQDERTAALVEQLQALRKMRIDSGTMSVRVITQRTNNPRQTRLLHRGDFQQPAAPVQPGAIATLPPLRSRVPDKPADRLDLARWLMADDHPLTPRVTVNHLWKHLFGEALVRTIDDFGVRGDRPTHPQLLDYLAKQFIESGWSRKAMIRQIVMSATYRQASKHRPELRDIDPTNKLLYRQNRFRVEAETVRDVHLAASGLLSRKIGGPSVYPPIPAGITDQTYNSSFRWKTSAGDDRYRRGMYTFFKRTAPHPNLVTFDCPDSNISAVARTRSNTPLGALVTLNNETFVEASRAMARRVLTGDLATDEERIARVFRLCVARGPRDAEVKRLTRLLQTSRAWYASHPDQAKAMVGNYVAKDVPATEGAAWVATVRIVMNTDEFIMRE